MNKTFKEFVTEAKTAKAEIERYTDLSRPLTRELYKHHAEGTQIPDEFEGHSIPALDAITKKSKLTKSIIVHTGVRHDPSTIADKDGHIHNPAFMSTSDVYSVAHKFATRQARRKDTEGHIEPAHVISIELKAGQHAVDISSKSKESHEKERLLPRNTKIKLNPVPDIKTDSTGRLVHHWSAHVVSQD